MQLAINGGGTGNSMPQMEKGKFYDLDPPANIKGKIFDRVRCFYQVSGRSDEYVVEGTPRGGAKTELFVLIFTDTGKVRPRLSECQNEC